MKHVYLYRPGHPQADENGMVLRESIGPPAARQRVHVISDAMAATWHPCDGKTYDSKSRFRAVTRQHGGVEVGNDRPTSRAPERDRTIRADIARAIAELGG